MFLPFTSGPRVRVVRPDRPDPGKAAGPPNLAFFLPKMSRWQDLA